MTDGLTAVPRARFEDPDWGSYEVPQNVLDQKPVRGCGDCRLCCKLLPVVELQKPRGAWCSHAGAGGCNIYDRRPPSCRHWKCGFVLAPDWPEQMRPSRCHFVVDMMATEIEVAIPSRFAVEQPRVEKRHALQIWADPAYPGCWRTPPARHFIMKVSMKHQIPALVRIGDEAVAVFPPNLTPDREWHEVKSRMRPDPAQACEGGPLYENRPVLRVNVERKGENDELQPAAPHEPAPAAPGRDQP